MNILPIYEPYADTLLALGIAAAFNVHATYHGGLYQFLGEPEEPIRFPTTELTDQKPEAPFTYHKFKNSVISHLSGKLLLPMLEANWNQTQPTYEDICELVLRPDFNDVNYKETRFWNVDKRYSGSAIFRPMEAKNFNSTKANGLGYQSTIKRFWLLDALRAIGFLTYAAPRILNREAPTVRTHVMLPVVTEPDFQDRIIHSTPIESAAELRVFAHLIASEVCVPRVIIVEYAELNPLARTPMRIWSFEPLDLSSDSIQNLKRITYNMKYLPMPEAHRECTHLWNWLADRDIEALSKFSQLRSVRLSVANDIDLLLYQILISTLAYN